MLVGRNGPSAGRRKTHTNATLLPCESHTFSPRCPQVCAGFGRFRTGAGVVAAARSQTHPANRSGSSLTVPQTRSADRHRQQCVSSVIPEAQELWRAIAQSENPEQTVPRSRVPAAQGPGFTETTVGARKLNAENPDRHNRCEYCQAGNRPARCIGRIVRLRPVDHPILPLGHHSLRQMPLSMLGHPPAAKVHVIEPNRGGSVWVPMPPCRMSVPYG